jgi:hypothetical protein
MKPLRGMLVNPKVGQEVISTEEIYVIVDVTENNNIMLKTIDNFDADGDKNTIIPKMFKFKEDHFKVLGMVTLDG